MGRNTGSTLHPPDPTCLLYIPRGTGTSLSPTPTAAACADTAGKALTGKLGARCTDGGALSHGVSVSVVNMRGPVRLKGTHHAWTSWPGAGFSQTQPVSAAITQDWPQQ